MEEGNLSLFSDKAPVFRLFTQAVFVSRKLLPRAIWLCSLEVLQSRSVTVEGEEVPFGWSPAAVNASKRGQHMPKLESRQEA
jgi:hypothetical protein